MKQVVIGMGSWKNTSLYSDVLVRPKVKENLKYFSKNFTLDHNVIRKSIIISPTPTNNYENGENTKKIYLFRYLTTGKVRLCTLRQQKQNILISSWKQVFDGEPREEDLIQKLKFSGCFLLQFSIRRWKLDLGVTRHCGTEF